MELAARVRDWEGHRGRECGGGQGRAAVMKNGETTMRQRPNGRRQKPDSENQTYGLMAVESM